MPAGEGVFIAGICPVTIGNGLVTADSGLVSTLRLSTGGRGGRGVVDTDGADGGEGAALVLVGRRRFICASSSSEVGRKTKRQKPHSLSRFNASTPLSLSTLVSPLLY